MIHNRERINIIMPTTPPSPAAIQMTDRFPTFCPLIILCRSTFVRANSPLDKVTIHHQSGTSLVTSYLAAMELDFESSVGLRQHCTGLDLCVECARQGASLEKFPSKRGGGHVRGTGGYQLLGTAILIIAKKLACAPFYGT